jgi:hypothetical protein
VCGCTVAVFASGDTCLAASVLRSLSCTQQLHAHLITYSGVSQTPLLLPTDATTAIATAILQLLPLLAPSSEFSDLTMLQEVRVSCRIWTVEFSHDSSLLAAAGQDGRIRLHRVRGAAVASDSEQMRTAGMLPAGSAAALSPTAAANSPAAVAASAAAASAADADSLTPPASSTSYTT